MLEAKSLTKSFSDIRAVDKVSFSAKKGEVVGFLGPNGAGKSTTMKMITGFLAPDSGETFVGGLKVSKNSVETRKLIGYLPENAPLYSEMLVRDFLQFVAEIRGLASSSLGKEIERVVEEVSLEKVLDRRIDKLSKGFKRRVGLAQAIIHQPELLILDEPTDGLDPNQKHEVRKLINRLAQTKCIVLSTHILEEVEEVCSRAIIVSEGKIVADDSPAGLCQKAGPGGLIDISFKEEVKEEFRERIAAFSEFREIHEFQEEGGGSGFRLFLPEPSSNGDFEGLESLLALTKEFDLTVVNMRCGSSRLEDVFRELTK